MEVIGMLWEVGVGLRDPHKSREHLDVFGEDVEESL
jgi:hypothetical protein